VARRGSELLGQPRAAQSSRATHGTPEQPTATHGSPNQAQSSQEQSGTARSSQEQPGAASSSQQQPAATKIGGISEEYLRNTCGMPNEYPRSI